MNASLIAAIVQERNHGGREANLAAIGERLREAAARGARLALLMELHNGPYFCQEQRVEPFEHAEPIPGPTTAFLGALAGELGMVVVGSVFERRAAGLYHNTAVVLDADGRLAGIYRKMHIPQDPGFEEKFYFTPGDLGFRPIPTAVGKLGVLVCWDQWFPEAARLMTLAGAELLLYPTAIGWDPRDAEDERRRQREAWMLVQRGHAVANALPVLVCNRVGHELPPGGGPGIRFFGSSFAAGPQGELLGLAGENDPELLLVEIDKTRSESVRRIWPFLRDRRVEAYGKLMSLWGDG